MAVDSFLPPVVTRLSMDIGDFVSGVAKAKAALKALDSKVEIPVNVVGVDKAIAQVKTLTDAVRANEQAQADWADAIRGATVALRYQGAAVDDDNKAITSMSRRLSTATAWQDKFKSAVEDTNGALDRQALAAMGAKLAIAPPDPAKAGGGGGGGWGWWNMLRGGVGLFGGAFGSAAIIGSIAAWHLAIDGALEATIAIVGATIALAAGLAAMAPAATDVYNRLIAIHQVAVSLNGGQGIPPFGGFFEQLQHQAAGPTIGAYGGLVNLMGNPGQYSSTIMQIVDGITGVVAKLDLWNKSQGGLNGVLQHGMGYASQFASIIGNLGNAVTNFMHAEPGTVHFLLDFINGAAQGVNTLSKLPTPILKAAMGIHSFLIYGGLLYSWAVKLAARLPFVGKGLSAFLAQPEIAATVGIVAILAYNWNKASNNVEQYIANQNKALAGMAPEAAFNALPGMQIGDLKQLSSAPFFAAQSGLDQLRHGLYTSDWGSIVKGATALIKTVAMGASGQGVAVSGDVTKLQGQYTALSNSAGNLYGEMIKLTRAGYSTQDAFSIMSLAGVKSSDSFAVMDQKVKNLITGYGDLGNSAGFLTNSINAVDFATEQQQSKITAVTQGWSAFIGMITGGISGLAGFEQQMIGLYQTAGPGSTKITVANGRVSATTTAATSAATAIGGLSSNTLQMYNAFASGVSDASNMLNTLYTLDSAAALGAKGVTMLGRAGKDAVAQLLPLAKGNQLLTTAAYAVAQQGGYKGGNSWQQLAKWVGDVKAPAKDLLGILTQFEVAAGNLGTDVKNLAGAIDPTMTSAMAGAIIQASGGTAVLEKLASTVLNNSGNARQMSSSFQGVWKQMRLVYGNTVQAKDQFEAFAIKLGVTQGAADKLWNDLQASGGKTSSAVQRDIAAIQAALAQLNGQTATVHVNVQTLQSMVTVPGSTGSSYGPLRTGYVIPKRPFPGLASGTSGAAPGWAWVGEVGPELVRFRGGESVIPNHVARGYAAGTGGEDAVHEINVYLDGRKIYQSMQREAVTTQRRTGSNGLQKRTR